MSQTLHNVFIHCVFHKKSSAPNIQREDQKRLNAFVQQTCNTHNYPCLIANGYGDHLHILIVLSPEMALSNLIREIKRTATLFLKETNAAYYHRFQWQSGYGAFSVSKKLKDIVYAYISHQEEHHQKHSTRDEFELLLKSAGIADYEHTFYWQ